jgi:flagellar M-ring protein FliF
VDGLTSDRVTVLDDSGRLLSNPTDDGSMAALTSTQLTTQREVESYLQAKAEGLVGDIVGSGNARVRVSAALNFDKIERQSQLVDPDKQATNTEQRYEITPGAQGGAASSNVATSFDNSKITESFSGAIGNIKRLSVAVLLNDRMVPPPANAPKDAKPTYVARTPEEIARVEALVKSAVGADSTRGDVVTVVATHLNETPLAVEPEVKPDVMTRVQQFQKPAISLAALVAMFVIATMLIKAIKSLPAPESRSPYSQLALAAPGGAPAPAYAATPMTLSDNGAAQGTPSIVRNLAAEPIAFPEQNIARNKVVATIAAKPDVSTRVVRAWRKVD